MAASGKQWMVSTAYLQQTDKAEEELGLCIDTNAFNLPLALFNETAFETVDRKWNG